MTMKLFVSGYGNEGSPSIGLYEISAGEPKLLWSDCPAGASFLCLTGDLLFAGIEHGGGGEILLYQAQNGGYTQKQSLSIQGGELCHLSYSQKYHTLYGSCYQTGHVAAAAVRDGRFDGIAAEIREEGPAPAEPGKTTSRAHFSQISPDNRYVYTVNIQQDRVYCYLPGTGTLSTNPAFPFLQLPTGKGPRHLCFHPLLPIVYLITEYSSEVYTLAYEAATGALTVISSYSALPDGFAEKSSGSGIVISADGKSVYTGNRGANTIGVFSAAADGSLKKIQDAPCGGKWPRHLALSKDGSCLFCANQFSNQVAVLPLSAVDGTISGDGLRIDFASPSFVEDVTME